MQAPNIIQIVLGSDNLPYCKHLSDAVLGSTGAGERLIHGEHNIGIPVEIMEGEDLLGGRDRCHDLDPAVAYVAVLVASLRDALAYLRDVVGLEPMEGELHAQEQEVLWGLARQQLDDGLDRQGFKTVGVEFRDPAATGNIFQRVKAASLSWTVAEPLSHIGGNHVVEPIADHMKTLSVPHELERQFGYSPEPERWWRPPGRDAGRHGYAA